MTATAPHGAQEHVPRPVILSVDDDPDVLRAVERDLKRHYAANYRVLRAASGQSALDALRQLKRRNEPVAMVVADQRMPGMTGVELLAEAKGLFPSMKSVLLTAYADTDAAIEAINRVRLDYYVLKPWDPPEASLYPVLDDLLEDWRAIYKPIFDATGGRYRSPASVRIWWRRPEGPPLRAQGGRGGSGGAFRCGNGGEWTGQS